MEPLDVNREYIVDALLNGDFETVRKFNDFDVYELSYLAFLNPTNMITLHRLGKIGENNINRRILDIILTRSLMFENRAGIEFWYKKIVSNNLDASLGLDKIATYFPEALLNLQPRIQGNDIPNVYIQPSILIKLLQYEQFPLQLWLRNDKWPGEVGKHFNSDKFVPNGIHGTRQYVRELYLQWIMVDPHEHLDAIVNLDDDEYFELCLSQFDASITELGYGYAKINKKVVGISDNAFVKLIGRGYKIKKDDYHKTLSIVLGSGDVKMLSMYLASHTPRFMAVISKVLTEIIDPVGGIPVTKRLFQEFVESFRPNDIMEIAVKSKDKFYAKRVLKKFVVSVSVSDLYYNPRIFEILPKKDKSKIVLKQGTEEFDRLQEIALNNRYMIPGPVSKNIPIESIIKSGILSLIQTLPRETIIENVQYLPSYLIDLLGIELDDAMIERILLEAIQTNNVFRVKYLWYKNKLPKTLKLYNDNDWDATMLLKLLGVQIVLH